MPKMNTYKMPSELQRYVDFLAANPSPTVVVAGKYYMVPCANYTLDSIYPRYVPLLGTVHEDRDVIGFKAWHVHVDTRFLTVKQCDNPIDQEQENRIALSRPLSLTDPYVLNYDREVLLCLAHAPLEMRKMQARRAESLEWKINEIVRWRNGRNWLHVLEDTYANANAACGVCPHRQIPLYAGRDMGNGVRQCPGHGLCWDRDGRMVRTAEDAPADGEVLQSVATHGAAAAGGR
jgi:nitrite reductase/ring-hydroxylating ferredoxin subunit